MTALAKVALVVDNTGTQNSAASATHHLSPSLRINIQSMAAEPK
jgi:hypothetical protein